MEHFIGSIAESLRDYTSMMERWTEEHVLGARVLRSKVAPNHVEDMRLEIAAGSAEITSFLDAFDECMKPVDLHLVTQKNSFKGFLGSHLQQTVPGQAVQMLQWLSQFCFGKDLVGFHSVLCFEYCVCDGQLHVLILDNHETTRPQSLRVGGGVYHHCGADQSSG
uniref:Uncharacterized protein n=1 Tax=Oryza punctata TaxID=4537 RepID=A0A0E0MIQ2_ORYPU